MATAEGLKLVFSAMKEADIDNTILALKSMKLLKKWLKVSQQTGFTFRSS
ncbi:hypothetical protein RHK29_14355 [Clostridioides difficile]|nr:hypothetical protein [Clostridioides difficile]